ncbi:uncharacterized protein LOC115999501 [Ipomoea triloba]|uniref:uncharacterized protein LOC115999501 n=1 Tax=Ipomoea triloba TaxID=35885 RepID=UPI00125CD48E|nr:uncharacterized protein LOC115999501 [Ipomoea triloba]
MRLAVAGPTAAERRREEKNLVRHLRRDAVRMVVTSPTEKRKANGDGWSNGEEKSEWHGGSNGEEKSGGLCDYVFFDAYTMVEFGRLIYIRTNQKALRCEAYKGLSDALTRGEVDPSTQGKRIILPSSFTGSARYMIQNYQDAMAICRWIGYPNLFITFTSNPKWPEIQRFVSGRNLRTDNRPDIVSRVFKMKLDCLIKELKGGKSFGPVRAIIYTVEFHKRGLPHAHILLFLAKNEINSSPDFMDDIISVEIPCKESDKEYYDVVQEFMIHGPCGALRKKSPCMVNGKCSKHFPKTFSSGSCFDADGYPVYRRRDEGNDRVTVEFYKSIVDADGNEVVDEINMYYDCRYVSTCEATWHLLGFELQYRTPPVERLRFHLPDCQSIVFQDDDSINDVINKCTIGQSMFIGWFEANKKYEDAKLLTYIEMPTKFVWKKDSREWHPRKKEFSIGRIFYVPPGIDELYYMRCLLNIVRGPTCFQDLHTFNGVEYDTFRDACYARGLLDNDKEYIDAFEEATSSSPADLLYFSDVFFFSDDIAHSSPANLLYSSSSLKQLEVHVDCVAGGISVVPPEGVDGEVHVDCAGPREKKKSRAELILNDDDKKKLALIEIERLLQVLNRSLKEFPPMPLPNFDSSMNSGNRLLYEELDYDRKALAEQSVLLASKLTDEQRVVYDSVIEDAIYDKQRWQDIVAATINSSYLWDNCKVLNTIGDAAEFEKLEVFANWIASIRDGTIGEQEDGFAEIDILSIMLLSSNSDPIATIVESTFPMFSNESVNHTFFRKSCNSSPSPRCGKCCQPMHE